MNDKIVKPCDYCGRNKITERLTLKILIAHFIDTTFSLDKGFIYTLKWLFINPNKPIKSFIEGNRIGFTMPAKYLVVTVTISVLATFLYDVETYSIVHVSDNESANVSIFYTYYQKYLNIILFSLIPIISFFSWLLGNKKKYNYAENLIANAYLFGTYNLFNAVLTVLGAKLTSINIITGSTLTTLSVSYILYGYFRFFDGHWSMRILKAIITMFFTFLSLGGAVAILIFTLRYLGIVNLT